MIYLDNAATSIKKPKCVINSFFEATLKNSVNAGRGAHTKSIAGVRIINDTSEKLAELLNIDNTDGICYTQNATYALNLAIGGILSLGGHCVVTQMEHNSVLRPVNLMSDFTVVNAQKNGIVKYEDVEKAINKNTKLIVCTHISNVCGSIQPVEKIGAIAKKYNIPYLVDCSQSIGCIDVNLKKINADMAAFSGHKGLMGPLGTGVLYIRDGLKLLPYITGGTGSMSESLNQPDIMPDMMHSGTMNTPAIKALGTAVDFIMKNNINEICAHERNLCMSFIDDLNNMDNVIVYGTQNINLRNGTVAFNIKNMDSSYVAEILNDKYNIQVRAGYHCAPLAHVALGTQKTGSVRVSFGFFNTKSHKNKITDSIFKIASKKI